MPVITEVTTRRDLNRFIGLPHRLHAGDPNFVAPLLVAERDRLSATKNPFFRHARMSLFLAREGDRVVGRIASIDDDNHNRTHNDNLVFFGFFEAEREDVALELYRAVEARARSLGRDAVRGPANPTLSEGAGFQIDAFDTVPYLMTPQNPPTYPRWAEAAGYRKIKDLQAWRGRVADGVGERLSRLAARVRRRHGERFRVRSVNMRRFGDDLVTLKSIYDEAWEQNWGQVPHTDAEFRHLGADLRRIVDPALAMFVEDEGHAVAALVALPDLNQVLHRFNGRLLPIGILHLLNRKRIMNRIRLILMGVRPAYRGRGLETLLIDELGRRAKERGLVECEMSWILEDNEGVLAALRAAGVSHYKTYRLYEKAL